MEPQTTTTPRPYVYTLSEAADKPHRVTCVLHGKTWAFHNKADAEQFAALHLNILHKPERN